MTGGRCSNKRCFKQSKFILGRKTPHYNNNGNAFVSMIGCYCEDCIEIMRQDYDPDAISINNINS